MASASLSSASAPDFAIAAYFNADLSIRSTPSFVASLARIASFRSESTRCCSVIGDNYDAQAQLSMLSPRLCHPLISRLSYFGPPTGRWLQRLGALANRFGVA